MTAAPTRRAVLGLGLGLAWTTGAWAATPGVETPPPPGPPRALDLPELHVRQWPNGLTVVVAPRAGLPLATAAIALRTGAEADPPGRAGLAGATAALLARGALRGGQAVGAGALAAQAEALGSTLDIGSGWRLTRASMTVSTPRVGNALALLADVVRHPLFAESELDPWRQQALDDWQIARADPSLVAAQVARRLHWGSSAYGAVVTPASLQRLRRSDLQAFHRRWMRPDRALLVLAGDVSPEQAWTLAERHLGGWRATAGAPAEPDIGTIAPLPARNVLVDMPGAGQSSVVLAAPFAAAGDADLRVGEVAAAVLGGGYSARLNQAVRIRRGLSYGVFGDSESHPAGGAWSAAAQTDHVNAGQVLQLLRDEVQRLADEPPGADELAARQAALLGSFARRWETTAGIAGTLASHWAAGRRWAALATYAGEVQAVSAAQVREFARRHWGTAGLRAVVAGDLAATGDTLGVAADAAWRVPVEALDFDRPTLGTGTR